MYRLGVLGLRRCQHHSTSILLAFAAARSGRVITNFVTGRIYKCLGRIRRVSHCLGAFQGIDLPNLRPVVSLNSGRSGERQAARVLVSVPLWPRKTDAAAGQQKFLDQLTYYPVLTRSVLLSPLFLQ